MKSLLEYHNKYIVAADDADSETVYLGLDDAYEPSMDYDLNGALLFSTSTEVMNYLKRLKNKHEIDDLTGFNNLRIEMLMITTEMVQKFSIQKL